MSKFIFNTFIMLFLGGGGRGGGGGRWQDQGPPETVIPLGYLTHTCQNDLVCKVTLEDVPYFNAPIFLKNKQQVGKIDEIFGTLKDYYVSVKLSDDVKATSFQNKDEVYILIFLIIFVNRNENVYCFFFPVFHRSRQVASIGKVSTWK
jgi:rRNA processing protein Gar1